MRSLPPGTRYSEIATISVVCGDLKQNRHFYGDLLGLSVAFESETLPEFQDDVADLTGVAVQDIQIAKLVDQALASE